MSYIPFIKDRLKAKKRLSKLDRINSSTVKNPAFFIISAGRSGSTILRKELIERCNVIIPSESEDLIIRVSDIYLDDISYDIKMSNIIAYLKEQSFLEYWKIDYDDLFSQLNEKRNSLPEILELIYQTQNTDRISCSIGDKTPYLNYYLQEINALFPSAKVIYLIRDPRAVIASYLKNRNHNLDQAIARWKSSIKTYLKYKSIFKNQIIEIKYEDYVSQNESQTSEIIDFLQLEQRSQKIKLDVTSLGDTHLAHHKNIQNPINLDSINKWKQQLTREQIDQINKKLKRYIIQFGYELTPNNV